MRRLSTLLGSIVSILFAFVWASVLSPSQASAAVTPAALQFGAAEIRVSEASKVARIPIVRTGTLTGSVTVDFATSGGTATEGSDYTGVTTNITLAAGVPSGSVFVPILSDTLNEPAETVGLTLTGSSVGPRASAVLTIVDNDPAGVISFGRSAFSANENAVTGVVQLVRVGGTASEASVMLITADGTATADADYTPVSSRVVFGANEKTKNVPIAISDDNLPEGNETVNLQILEPSGGATLGKQTNATLTIVDDEIAISFSRAAYSVPERGGTALVTVMRSGPRNQAVSVNLSTTQYGTAIPDLEFKPLTNLLVKFASGVAAKTITLALRDDTLDDGDKTVELELSDPSAPAQLGTIQKTVVTLVDNDAGGTINFSAPVYNTTETAAKAPIMIRRTGGSASGVTVQLRTSNGTAEAGSDYREVVTNLTFNAGELIKTVFIPIVSDSIVEDTETVLLTLSDATGGAVLGTNAQAVLRIANDDRGGAIQFSAASYSVSESGTNAIITLVRSGGLASGVEVEVAVTGGTATLGDDYSGLPAIASFAAGATTTKVMVPIVNDDLIEGTETVGLQLRNSTGGAVLGAKTNATLTIKDDGTVPPAPTGMALIPAGSFTMGDTFNEGESYELPLHTVYVSAFYMDRTEVTKALWDTVKTWATANGYNFDNYYEGLPVIVGGFGKAPNHPVHSVSWHDCVKWCNARSQKEGRTPAYYTDVALTQVYKTGQVEPGVKWNAGYRLPTAAEWEKAARGGASGHRFPWSNVETITHSQANYYSDSSESYDLSPTPGYHPTFNDGVQPYTSPVGYFAANGYGLYDMAGNVWELCWDWFGPYSSGSQTNPRGPSTGSYRVVRGGGWNSGAIGCRSAYRNSCYPGNRYDFIGLRVVLAPGQP